MKRGAVYLEVHLSVLSLLLNLEYKTISVY